MIALDNQTDLALNLDKLEKIIDVLSTKEVELLIVNDEKMIQLNSEHREKDTLTDVLSFPMQNSINEPPFAEQSIFAMPLGSIVIAASMVEEKAKLFQHTEQDELSLLFIHGILHLLGFDHEEDDGEMRAKEKELIEAFVLPKSLIIRTEN